MRSETMQSQITMSKGNSLLALSLLCTSTLASADRGCLETINEAQNEAVKVATIYAELAGKRGIGETCQANPSSSECRRVANDINTLERQLGYALHEYTRLNRRVEHECKK